MQFKSFTLDDFQVKAIESVERNNSVVVSAATGTGKTLIADYVIDKYLKEGKRVIYTAPIKALSNQKYRDFTHDYGKEAVGIITGDVQHNTSAPVLIMTTEIYRNMLLAKDPLIRETSYVVFDEIHFISDIERGTIWEESVIFSPEHIRFLCLSATIPNAEQFAAWISSIKHHPVDVVRYAHRAVPLKHWLFDVRKGLTTTKELKHDLELDRFPQYEHAYKRAKHKQHYPVPEHTDLVHELKRRNWLPCLFFVFSRAQCEKKAKELAKTADFLSPKDKTEVSAYFRNLADDVKQLESVKQMRTLAAKGICVHHAGLLPQLKEVVELLFAAGLVAVLYTTETFAVGLNLPAKAVCFSSLEKFDGANFRYLNSKEYFQLAGRAGRRGIDTEGHAVALVNRNTVDIERVAKFTAADVEPIQSQFRLSINTALHLASQHTPEEAELILKSSFDHFVRKSEQGIVHVMASYNNKLKLLRKMGYLEENQLTDKGHFLLQIYASELFTGELFATDTWTQFSDDELSIIGGMLAYEERKNVHFAMKHGEIADRIVKKLSRNQYLAKAVNKLTLKRLTMMFKRWHDGCDFNELLNCTDMQEGDIIHLMRRALDILRQIRHATADRDLAERVSVVMQRMDRDLVKVEL